MIASLSRSATRDPFAPSGAAPARVIDLAICALLAVVTVGLLVSAMAPARRMQASPWSRPA